MSKRKRTKKSIWGFICIIEFSGPCSCCPSRPLFLSLSLYPSIYLSFSLSFSLSLSLSLSFIVKH